MEASDEYQTAETFDGLQGQQLLFKLEEHKIKVLIVADD